MYKRFLALLLSATMVMSAPISVSATSSIPAKAVAGTADKYAAQEADYATISDACSDSTLPEETTPLDSSSDGTGLDGADSDSESTDPETAIPDDASSEGTPPESTDPETVSPDDASLDNTDSASEEESEPSALDASSELLSIEEDPILTADSEVPTDHIYDDLIFSQYYNFKALYISELSTTPKDYNVELSLGNTLYPITDTKMLSEFFGEEITTDILKDKFVVETVIGSGDSYTPVSGSSSPVNVSFGEKTDGSDDLTFYLSAGSATPDGKYYLHIKFDFPEHFKDTTSAKEIYVPLIKAPKSEVLCDSKEEAYAAVRDIIRKRTNNLEYFDDASNYQKYDNFVYDRFYVESSVFPKGSILLSDVCDFEEEREGMAPYEGDYMFNLLGNRIQKTFYYESPSFADKDGNTFGTKTVGDKFYNVYEVYLPVITTKEEEDALDNRIATLLDTEFADVATTGVSNKQKIQAVFSYIRNHVSGTVSGDGGSDRTYPPYHTAYHALINGNGTCEAFAQLFTRLTRELGVPSKVIMGLDSANHTYNIVDGGDSYWYYIDCSAGLYLTDSKNFKRAAEQERYTSPKFISNYLNKVKGGSNYTVDTIKVLDENGEVVIESYDLDDIYDLVNSNSSNYPDRSWTIRFDCDWTIELESRFDYPNPDNITLDLNNHTLTCKNDCLFNIGYIKNGTVKVGHKDGWSSYSGNMYLNNAKLENITIQSVTGFDHLAVPPSNGIVSFKNVTVKGMDVLINYDRNSTGNQATAIIVDGTLTLDGCYFYVAGTSDSGAVMKLTKGANLCFTGTTTFGGWDYPIPPEDNYQPSGNVTNDYFEGTPIEVVPAEEGRSFSNGDVLATYSGTLKKITSQTGKTSPARLEDFFDIEKTSTHKSPEDTTLDLLVLEKSLRFAKATYSVSSNGEKLKDFITLAEAASYINSLSNASAEYTVTLLDDNSPAEFFSLPTKAKKVTISGGENTYTFHHSGNATLSAELVLENLILAPATRNAALNLNGKTLTLNNVTYAGDTGNGAYSSITGSGSSALVINKGNTLDITAKVNVANVFIYDGKASCSITDLTATNLYLMPGSEALINNSAVITNLYLGKNKAGETVEGDACILRKESASIAVNTKFTSADPQKSTLVVKTVDSEGKETGTKGNTVLFTTKMKTFPYELVKLSQKDPYSDYSVLYRIGNNICVGKAWLTVLEDETEKNLGQYVKWSDAISAIDEDGKNYKPAEYRKYVIILDEDVDIMQKMTFPKKAKSLTVQSSGLVPYTLTHRGDLAPTLPVVFRTIALDVPDSINSKLSLGGNTVSFITAYSANTYSTITGNARSSLQLLGDELDSAPLLSSKGTINVGSLLTKDYDITSQTGALTVSTAAILTSTNIDVATNVSFKTLTSTDGNNSISYSSSAKGSFKISGNMYVSDGSIDIYAQDKNEGKGIINSCAISICNKYMSENGYPAGKDLVTGAKVPACFFVVEKSAVSGTEENESWTVKYRTRKVKNGIRINTEEGADTSDSAVILRECDDEAYPLYTLGYFADLKSAFDEIKTIGSTTSHYLIIIDGSKSYGQNNPSLDTTNISTPAKAASLTITSLDPATPAYLHIKNSLSLGSPLTLKDICIGNLTDSKGNTVKLGISIAGKKLRLENVNVPGSDANTPSERIGKISGNGVSGTSVLELVASGSIGAYDTSGSYSSSAEAYTLAVNADLSNVGSVVLSDRHQTKSQNLLIAGKTNVGSVSIYGSSTVTSFATVKRNKTGTITSVSGPITINGIVSEEASSSETDTLGIILLEKDKSVIKGILSDLTYEEAALNPEKPAFRILKAPVSGAFRISVPGTEGKAEIMKKNSSYYLVNSETVAALGYYHLESDCGKYSSVLYNNYISFADVVKDINTMKDKEANYSVVAIPAKDSDSMTIPEKYAMPKAAALTSLGMGSTNDQKVSLKYPAGTTLTFSCDTLLRNIDFVASGHEKPLNLNIGKNRVLLLDTNCDKNFGNISGSGIGNNKTSVLEVGFIPSDDPAPKELIVTGNMSGVNTLYIGGVLDSEESARLTVYGKTNVGSIIYRGENSHFTGSATIKLDKSKTVVTAVTSNVTIVNDVGTADATGSSLNGTFELSLLYKNGKAYLPVIGDKEGSFSPDNIEALTTGAFKLFNTSNIYPGSDESSRIISYTGCASEDYSVTRVKNTLYLNRN